MPAVADASTRFAGLTPKRAWLALLCLAAFVLVCQISLRSGPLYIENKTQESDVKMFRRVVNRMSAGEAYYEALGAELRNGGYPTRSVFNWRSPLHLTSIQIATEPVSRWVLAALAAGAMLLATLATNRAGGPGLVQFVVTGLAVSECFLFNLDFHLYPEVWAGVLLVISVSAYEFDCWPAAVAAGLPALFYRELAMPYVLVSLAFALRRKRRAEVLAWLVGLALWAFYFLMHAQAAIAQVRPTDMAVQFDWVRFGGLRFVLLTTLMSLLVGFPNWVAALFFPAMLFGLAGWRSGIGSRVGILVAVYMAAFSVVGMPVNMYWGAVTNPLLAFGLVWFLPSAIDLVRSLVGRWPRGKIAEGAPPAPTAPLLPGT